MLKALSLLVTCVGCSCVAPNAAGVKREAVARLEDCLGANVAHNLDAIGGCVDDVLLYCNGQGMGALCSRQELLDCARFESLVRPVPDGGAR